MHWHMPLRRWFKEKEVLGGDVKSSLTALLLKGGDCMTDTRRTLWGATRKRWPLASHRERTQKKTNTVVSVL